MNRTTHSLRAVIVILLAAAGLLTTPGQTAAQESTDRGAPGSWLDTYVGARTLGLGGAFVGTADDVSAVLWNPAGLSQLVPNEVHFETARLFEDTSIHSLGFAVPGRRLPSFAVSVVTLRSGTFERTNELNDPLGTFSDNEIAYFFTMSRSLTPRLALGLNAKLVQQSVEDFSANGFGFDLGGLFDVTPTVRVGASLQNLGGPNLTLRTAEESYPVHARVGLAVRVLGGRGLLTAEMDKSGEQSLGLHGGTEYWVQPMLALRVGMNQQEPGGGFSYRFANSYQLDYGLSDHALGMAHRVGITYRFGGFFASAKATPEVFSPTGENAVTKIDLNARTKANTQDWSLALVDKANTVVRTYGGQGVPPAHLLWDGKDQAGLPVADGTYRYSLVVRDAEGRQIESPERRLEISTTGPQGAVPVIPLQQ
jgi:hypothetical protein